MLNFRLLFKLCFSFPLFLKTLNCYFQMCRDRLWCVGVSEPHAQGGGDAGSSGPTYTPEIQLCSATLSGIFGFKRILPPKS